MLRKRACKTPWGETRTPRKATAQGSHVAPARERRPLWVTRHRPKIDRIACRWLIRPLVDAKAWRLFAPLGHCKRC
ncbi:chromate resistance protein ChrB domain-containing protein [Leisingera sp. S232]|uniref:chromate resistance protein ChrB domain-containing protein n=1 Tax=Leisingera sp. S232 TaxID=3415132 RepID=UPI003C7AF97E